MPPYHPPQNLAAAARNGYIYTSNNGGQNWTEQAGSGVRGWYGITSSSDGSKLAAAVRNDYIYTSADFGNTWILQSGSPIRNWWAIISSSDFTVRAMRLGASGGPMTAATHRAIELSSFSSHGPVLTSPQKLAAAGQGQEIFLSSNAAVNWTAQTNAGSQNWNALASSIDGSRYAAVPLSGFVYTSP